MALKSVNPHLFTIATLTGHAYLTVGCGYSIVLDNGLARKENNSLKIVQAAEKIGDPFEVSTIKREDYAAHKGKAEGEDLLQANNLPSSKTPRGHQNPAAYLIMASGLDKLCDNLRSDQAWFYRGAVASMKPKLNILTIAYFPKYIYHSLDSSKPLKYSHIDIAGSSGDVPENATGSPVLALFARFLTEYFESVADE